MTAGVGSLGSVPNINGGHATSSSRSDSFSHSQSDGSSGGITSTVEGGDKNLGGGNPNLKTISNTLLIGGGLLLAWYYLSGRKG